MEEDSKDGIPNQMNRINVGRSGLVGEPIESSKEERLLEKMVKENPVGVATSLLELYSPTPYKMPLCAL